MLTEKKGKASTLELTSEAATEVGKFLFSASLIIMLVFIPLLTLGGIEGAMFRPTAFAVAAALFGSLILNLTLQPILASFFLTERQMKGKSNPINKLLIRGYNFLLEGSFRFKKTILTGFVLLIFVAGYAYTFLGKEFVPPLDEGAIMASTGYAAGDFPGRIHQDGKTGRAGFSLLSGGGFCVQDYRKRRII